MTIPSEVLRKCTKCGAEKPATDFYTRKSGRYHGACKSCFIGKQKARRFDGDRESFLKNEREWTKGYRAKLRDETFAAYGGYVCACCGETAPKFLTIDHINNDGAKFRRETLGNRWLGGYHTYRWLKANGFPQGDLQVLCMNCQQGKKLNGGVCPHQETCNDYPAREYGQAAGSATPLS